MLRFVILAAYVGSAFCRWNPSLGNLPLRKECPASNFGCIFDDLPHSGHTDCTRGGTGICQAVGADYCGAFIGFPPRRTCCVITGVKTRRPNPDSRGCPGTNRGCIFDDYPSNTPCFKGGNELCREAGLDYCGAVFSYPGRRVCCKIAQDPSRMPTSASDDYQCPSMNMGCIFDTKPGEIECTTGGNKNCTLGGEDYCGAEVDGTRMCCVIVDKKSRGRPIPSAKACPAKNRGCVFTDEFTNSECTKNGDPDCLSAETDYCGAFYGFPPKRSCCNIGKTIPTIPVKVPVPVPAEVPVPVPAPLPVPVPVPNPAAPYPPFNPSLYPAAASEFGGPAGFGAPPPPGLFPSGPFGAPNSQFPGPYPQFGAGNPQFGAGNPQFGAGNPQFGAGNPQFGDGSLQFEGAEPANPAGQQRLDAGFSPTGDENFQFSASPIASAQAALPATSAAQYYGSNGPWKKAAFLKKH